MQTTQLSLSLIPKFKASGPQSMSRSHQDAHAHTLPATIFTAQQEPGLLKPGPTPLSTCPEYRFTDLDLDDEIQG